MVASKRCSHCGKDEEMEEYFYTNFIPTVMKNSVLMAGDDKKTMSTQVRRFVEELDALYPAWIDVHADLNKYHQHYRSMSR